MKFLLIHCKEHKIRLLMNTIQCGLMMKIMMKFLLTKGKDSMMRLKIEYIN